MWLVATCVAVAFGCGWRLGAWRWQLDMINPHVCGGSCWMWMAPTCVGGSSWMCLVPTCVTVAVAFDWVPTCVAVPVG